MLFCSFLLLCTTFNGNLCCFTAFAKSHLFFYVSAGTYLPWLRFMATIRLHEYPAFIIFMYLGHTTQTMSNVPWPLSSSGAAAHYLLGLQGSHFKAFAHHPCCENVKFLHSQTERVCAGPSWDFKSPGAAPRLLRWRLWLSGRSCRPMFRGFGRFGPHLWVC